MSLSLQQQRAIAALLTSKNKAAAASAAGISTRTLQRYFDDAEFVAAYRTAFAGLLEDAARQSQQMISPCLDTLSEIMQDTDISPAARVSAARAALEYTLRLTEANDIIAQIREIAGGEP